MNICDAATDRYTDNYMFLEGNMRLTKEIYAQISDPENEIYVSRISLFEVAIKLKIGGRLNLRRGLAGLILDCKNEAIEILPITNDHLLAYDQVPFFDDHRDPFDRLLIATALAEKMPLISADEKFSRYQDIVDIIW